MVDLEGLIGHWDDFVEIGEKHQQLQRAQQRGDDSTYSDVYADFIDETVSQLANLDSIRDETLDAFRENLPGEDAHMAEKQAMVRTLLVGGEDTEGNHVPGIEEGLINYSTEHLPEYFEDLNEITDFPAFLAEELDLETEIEGYEGAGESLKRVKAKIEPLHLGDENRNPDFDEIEEGLIEYIDEKFQPEEDGELSDAENNLLGLLKVYYTSSEPITLVEYKKRVIDPVIDEARNEVGAGYVKEQVTGMNRQDQGDFYRRIHSTETQGMDSFYPRFLGEDMEDRLLRRRAA